MTPSSAPAVAPARPNVPPPGRGRPGSPAPEPDPRRPLPPAAGLLPAGAALLRVPSPVGRLELVGEGGRVVALSIATDGVLPLDHLDDRPSPVLAETARQLGEYFVGLRTSFEVPVRLTGTPFQVAVWEALARVPHGGVTTYGALAQAAGRPGGARAVGGAVGANR
ncbi:methylated-DNA--[protein]-cysteine S-methyltransferase, partial [Clavibacter michiganensis]